MKVVQWTDPRNVEIYLYLWRLQRVQRINCHLHFSTISQTHSSKHTKTSQITFFSGKGRFTLTLMHTMNTYRLCCQHLIDLNILIAFLSLFSCEMCVCVFVWKLLPNNVLGVELNNAVCTFIKSNKIHLVTRVIRLCAPQRLNAFECLHRFIHFIGHCSNGMECWIPFGKIAQRQQHSMKSFHQIEQEQIFIRNYSISISFERTLSFQRFYLFWTLIFEASMLDAHGFLFGW